MSYSQEKYKKYKILEIRGEKKFFFEIAQTLGVEEILYFLYFLYFFLEIMGTI
jgi:hypothetical protein